MSQSITERPEQVTELTKLLRVNLSERSIQVEEISKEYRDKFVSGKGLGAALLLDEVDAGVDPLSPENNLYFMFGPITGFAPGTSRYAAITKSPLTGTFVDSYSGGHFPTMVRYALPDFLAVAFEGVADDPVALRITEDEVALEDATDLWGADTKETARHFSGRNTKVACIGPAGENRVKFATITSDEGTHHAGRGGVGAVMGSKNLKAVVATGNAPPAAPDIQELKVEHTQRLGTSEEVSWARNGGTQLIVDWTQEVGALPSHNWTRGTIDDADDLNIDAFSAGHVGTDSCFGCPVACGHVVDFEDSGVDGSFKGASVDWGPEYETIGMMGANTDITNVTEVTELANLADTLGMDTISLGNVLSWLMEVAERGLVESDLSWGDAETAAEIVRRIAVRDGIGDALAEGTAGAAEILCDGHPDAREAAVEVKGMELPAYEPRASFGMALAYATSDRGGCHQRAWPIGSDAFGGERDPYDTAGHAAAVVEEQDENALTFSMVSCSFTAYNYERVCEWLNVLGYDLTVEELHTIGERAWNMTRLFNVREGFSREDDAMPERFTRPLESGGPADGNAIDDAQFETMLDDYYEARGWTDEGVPTAETLERLEIDSLAPSDRPA
ncbi:aldehyde ferredoxin oxidoreductase family protein [Halovivax sp.]|uniref:aldehyde ferredoxin oxidoreductase family protein n=1 Tax=Halovivax sp. TaxID=1935978 RepID=UPI0025BF9176|nr:aldehyde ferredoxin oxidoreductase family protein [Halovivax sp.]